jgi:site-specific recombinase XerD
VTDSRLSLAELVTGFFTRHLAAELNASPHTIASYRDTFRFLLRHLAESTRRKVSQLTYEDFTPDGILAFLEHLERERHNSTATRNARLAAIRSFFSYVVTRDPAAAAVAQRVLSIPFKKAPRRIVGHLSQQELLAILNSPDRSTPTGRRNYLVLALLYDSGARVQELINLRPADFRLDRLPLVRIMGKGRKERIAPLVPATAKLIRNYLDETNRLPTDTTPLLLNYRGEKMNRSGIRFLIDKYCQQASELTPSLQARSIGPHSFRHTKGMHLLLAGVSPVTIKDILGHAHIKTIEIYVQADLEMKRQALNATKSPIDVGVPVHRSKPDLLHWLEQL